MERIDAVIVTGETEREVSVVSVGDHIELTIKSTWPTFDIDEDDDWGEFVREVAKLLGVMTEG